MHGRIDQLGPSPDRPETPQVTGDGSFSAPDAWALLYTRRGVLIGRIQEFDAWDDDDGEWLDDLDEDMPRRAPQVTLDFAKRIAKLAKDTKARLQPGRIQ